MFLLVADVFDDPGQVAGAERDHAVAGLPLQNFAAVLELPIRFMGRRAFELADQVADQDGRGDGNNEMDVGFGAVDFVNECARQVDEFLFQITMHEQL